MQRKMKKAWGNRDKLALSVKKFFFWTGRGPFSFS